MAIAKKKATSKPKAKAKPQANCAAVGAGDSRTDSRENIKPSVSASILVLTRAVSQDPPWRWLLTNRSGPQAQHVPALTNTVHCP